MKVVVLGGGGFIGSAVVDRLLLEGHDVRVFERSGVDPYRDLSAESNCEWRSGDFMNRHDIADAIAGMDAVVHLVSATLPKSSNDDPVFDIQSNLVPLVQLLHTMEAQHVGRLVFVSSGGTVYGHHKYLPIDERHPTEPDVPYGITKLAIEKYIQLFHRTGSIRSTILRLANPYGERRRIDLMQGAVDVFVWRALSGHVIEVVGDGSVVRDYVYIRDVADAFARALAYNGNECVLNISTGIGTSLVELINMIEGATGKPVQVAYHPPRTFDIPVSVLDNTLARTELGWTPKVSLKEGVERTIKWIGAMSSSHDFNRNI